MLDDKANDIEVLYTKVKKQNEMIGKYDEKLSEHKDEILGSLENKVRNIIKSVTPPLEKILEPINETPVQTISDALVPFRSRQDKIELESQHNIQMLANQVSELLGYMRRSETQSLKCDQCGKSFEEESRLRNHKRMCHKPD